MQILVKSAIAKSFSQKWEKGKGRFESSRIMMMIIII